MSADGSQNIVDSLPCRRQSFRRGRENQPVTMRNANKSLKISYPAII